MESNLTISGIESILSHEIKNNQYFKDGSGKEQFLSEMTSKIIELVERIDVYWAYFYIVPEFNDLGTGVSIRKEGNEIIIETAGNPKEFAKVDPSYSWYFDPLEKGEVWTNPYDWYGDTLISHTMAMRYQIRQVLKLIRV